MKLHLMNQPSPQLEEIYLNPPFSPQNPDDILSKISLFLPDVPSFVTVKSGGRKGCKAEDKATCCARQGGLCEVRRKRNKSQANHRFSFSYYQCLFGSIIGEYFIVLFQIKFDSKRLASTEST